MPPGELRWIDDHHVFPQGYLEEHRPDVTHLLRDCVLNRTLIDKETNIRISKRAPSDYLTEIRTTIGAKHFDHLLSSHLLPGESSSGLLTNQFEDFLDQRQAMVMAVLAEVTGLGVGV